METEKPPACLPFPVVGIGASAGGYPALITLLQNMPPSSGMALVVILHLAPGEPSTADRLLQSATDMPVVQVGHTMPVLPDKVYVIPPDRSLSMRDGELVLGRLERSRGGPVAIDIFLRTLADAHHEYAIGIVLSGMGSDGTAGLACIKEMGGMTIVQLPSDAEHGSMPRSAIGSGMADFVLPAHEMPRKLLELRDTLGAIRRKAHAGNRLDGVPLDMGPFPEVTLRDVLAVLHERTGHDFTHYRRSTLLRRLERRLQVRGTPDLADYYQLLRKDSAEAPALMKDLLIGVTSFYRDRDAFESLGRVALPELFRSGRDPVRAWVAACSTGEEAYTVAMLLADQAVRQGGGADWQIFASDIDEHAIGTAGAGLYPISIAESIPEPQLMRWFTREADQYKVRRSLRDRILFTRHNLLHEPAFSRLDLISCRNFLIYLNREMHRHLLQQFHFALNPGGYLMLGSAESVEAATDLFVPVDAARKIYQARQVARSPASLAVPLPSAVPAPALPIEAGAAAVPPASRRGRLFSFAEIHLHKAAELAPPSILLDAEGDILHISEQAVGFLRQAGGEPTRELLRLVLPELQLPLRAALFQARKSAGPASTGPLRCEREQGAGAVDLQVLPFQDPHAEGGLMLVRFVELPEFAAQAAPVPPQDQALLDQLDEELRHTRRQLRETIEHAEAAAGEMRIYGEEMQATVEELRAAAAELERSRNELLSANRELTATNLDLRRRAEEAAKAHDDLGNLVASSDVATIFLDREMRILRYTPRIADFFNVIPADIGRPLLHITNRLDAPRLAEDAAQVFVTLQVMEREVRSTDGRDYIVRVHPYRTTRHSIDGAVMTFFDITSRRAAEEAMRESEERLRLFVTASSDILYRMSADWSEMRVLQGKGFLANTDAPSRSWIDTYIPAEERPRVQAAISRAIAERSIFELEHRVIGKDGGVAWTFSRAIPLLDAEGKIVEWFGAANDITRRKREEEARRESEARLSTIFESLPVGVCVMKPDGTMLLSNRIMHHYLPTGVMPSIDRVRGERWRAWHEDGRPVGFMDFPGARALRGEWVVPGIEMLYLQDDGREIWTQVAAAAVVDGDGRSTGEAAVVITDIDVLKRTGHD
ncbi:CheR family methyltransferase [Massilia norwichensis]|uniref:protein-glutamate O-methyltransferase n=1 Tax=Massilia norwichensis TaxID=1442366 RepID=A0ABT2A5I1_9BURK|nr:CheR family methyltransferase [Massilia norwichensis]MCS0589439.1 PAS domain-containing protein [Massilia norwichensis]